MAMWRRRREAQRYRVSIAHSAGRTQGIRAGLSAQRDGLAHTLREGRAIDRGRGERVLYGQADRLEERDLVGVGATGDAAQQELAQTARDAIRADAAFGAGAQAAPKIVNTAAADRASAWVVARPPLYTAAGQAAIRLGALRFVWYTQRAISPPRTLVHAAIEDMTSCRGNGSPAACGKACAV